MAIRRRETSDGPRFDVEWRLPDRTKRRKTFRSERQARIFEASIVTKSAAGDIVDPHAGRVTLATVFRPWFASRLGSQPEGSARLRGHLAPAHRTPIRRLARHQDRPPVDSGLGQRDVRIGPESPHGALGAFGAEDDAGLRDRRRPIAVAQSRGPDEVSATAAYDAHLSHDDRGSGAGRRVRRSGRRRVAPGLHAVCGSVSSSGCGSRTSTLQRDGFGFAVRSHRSAAS